MSLCTKRLQVTVCSICKTARNCSGVFQLDLSTMLLLASSGAPRIAPSGLGGLFGDDSSQVLVEELSGSLGRLFLIIWSPFYSCRSVPEIYGSDFFPPFIRPSPTPSQQANMDSIRPMCCRRFVTRKPSQRSRFGKYNTRILYFIYICFHDKKNMLKVLMQIIETHIEPSHFYESCG
jgi:hypothetical protein